VDVDILKSTAYKRIVDGTVADSSKLCKNLINKELVQFLDNKNYRWLFERNLKQLHLNYKLSTFQSGQSFQLSIDLWENSVDHITE